MEGFLIMIGLMLFFPLMGYLIFVVIIPSGEWCYKKIHNFFLRCPQWVQNTKNSVKKGVGAVISVLLGIFVFLGMCFVFFDGCTRSCSSHHYDGEDYEYFDDAHRPDRF